MWTECFMAIDNFAMLKNSNGDKRFHSILLDYWRKEYCTTTGWNCKEFPKLGVARRRDVCLGIFSRPMTQHETESHQVNGTLPTFRATSSMQYE